GTIGVCASGTDGPSFMEMGFGFSLEQPTPSAQTISTAANTSAFLLFQTAVANCVVLPQATESRGPANWRIALLRVMVGHLLPSSGTSQPAEKVPSLRTLIRMELSKS